MEAEQAIWLSDLGRDRHEGGEALHGRDRNVLILVLLTGSFGELAQGSFTGTLVLMVVSGAIGIGSFLSIVFVTRA
jgi:hypothetical protein